MRPILAAAARALGTDMDSVGWLEAGMLPTDALRRFPYEEHPLNIALVLRMAKDIGVDEDFALREMADRVVPDIGVLKAYPVTAIRGRRLQFVMGNSANEKFGALGNWRRMDFDKHDAYVKPGVLLTAVVNNRADRVPRSRVFADLLVNDISLDLIVLIGSNLKGMQGYIDEALDVRVGEATLWPETQPETSGPRDVFEAAARNLRIAYRDQDVADRLRAMLEGLPVVIDIDTLVARRNTPDDLMSVLSAANVEAEVNRYIADPGQALAYKIGELKIRELRARAERTLGKSFDLRRFHDAVLGQGAVTLNVLDDQIKAWVAAEGRRR